MPLDIDVVWIVILCKWDNFCVCCKKVHTQISAANLIKTSTVHGMSTRLSLPYMAYDVIVKRTKEPLINGKH